MNVKTRDQHINRLYSHDCIVNEKVRDLPFFSKIIDRELKLIGYKLNTGICKAARLFFVRSNWRLNMAQLIQELHLDDNNLTDADFATLLDGIST